METNITVTKLNIASVISVYSGRPGCMCGCRGKYIYSTTHRDFASKNRGYEVQNHEVNNHVVRMMVNKILKMRPRLGKALGEIQHAWVETETRSYCIYFKV